LRLVSQSKRQMPTQKNRCARDESYYGRMCPLGSKRENRNTNRGRMHSHWFGSRIGYRSNGSGSDTPGSRKDSSQARPGNGLRDSNDKKQESEEVTPSETSLLETMQTLSRKYFKNDWEDGLEYILWHWMQDRCQCPLTPMEKFNLYSRYNRANGWFVTRRGQPHYVKREVWVIAYEREFGED
jgi:trehalose-6-phosphate synthase